MDPSCLELRGQQLKKNAGESLVLTPNKVPTNINSIIWKNGREKVADWDKDFGLEIYGIYKYRTELDQTTGVLTINNLSIKDSGVYSVEINSKVFGTTFTVYVFSQQLNKKAGKSLVLTPNKVPTNINSIIWKNGIEKVAEWDKDFGLEIYGNYKERTELDQATGVLTINNLSIKDSGVYSVEINSKVFETPFTVSVFKAVPNPQITYSCNSDKTLCTLTCDGDTTDAGTVSYQWKIGEGNFEQIGKQLGVTKTGYFKTSYTCQLVNAVSSATAVFDEDIFGPVFVFPGQQLNRKAGDILVLTPNKVPTNINSIIWKNGREKVAEWDKDFGLEIYGIYKYRTVLDQITGVLTINNLSIKDSGVYSVEINSKVFETTFTVSVFSHQLNNKLGDSLVLTPNKVPTNINSIIWKNGIEKVAEWDKDFGLEIYGNYKYRTELDQATGVLTINNLSIKDSGVYSVEINSKVFETTFTVFVFKAVPNPQITYSCNSDKTLCTLSCDGDTTDAGTVSYQWKIGEGNFEQIGKQLGVTKTGYFKTSYTCQLVNAVSSATAVFDEEIFGPVFVFPGQQLNRKAGDSLVLTPNKVPTNINSIIWKNGREKVAEWDKDFGLEIYGIYKERTVLDQTTGVLTINNLSIKDSGVYSVEINSKVLKRTFTVSVFSHQLNNKVGDSLVLTPNKVPTNINSIIWKNGREKVAEWDKDFGLEIYGNYKDRTELDQTTGVLTINNLSIKDSGVYSVEINSKVFETTFTVSVFKAVPNPQITYSCNSDKTLCTLTCDGDTTDAGTVSYQWKIGEGNFEQIGKQLGVTKTGYFKTSYTCQLVNAVSSATAVFDEDIFGPVFVFPGQQLNRKAGDSLVLTPNKVPTNINSIIWKNGREKVAEWDKDFDLEIYGIYKYRTELDQTTGVLTINNLSIKDSGVYSVEINSKVFETTFTVSVFSMAGDQNAGRSVRDV
ncbi:hypothetical protein UPYG_G00061310 [Umbra pygmaea]|uniref:Immunoglobulin domain-containing protein n=1 Tax=Umbra pygmaea TaxID=75934 RepID=A0ABD0X9F2_UMBPY